MDPANFSTLVQAIVAVATMIITTLVAPWLLKQGRIADGKLDDQQRQILYPALNYAIAYAASISGLGSPELTALQDDAKGRLIDKAVGYIKLQIPGVLEQLGVTEDGLRRLLESRWAAAVALIPAPTTTLATK